MFNKNPREFSAPVFWCKPYISYRSTQVLDPLSHIIRCLKISKTTNKEIVLVVEVLIECFKEHPELMEADAIIAMPRKVPDKPSDMQIIADKLGKHFGMSAPKDFLIRTKTPNRGEIIDHRLRFKASDHAKSFKVVGEDIHDSIIILDNVLTTGSTMEGAIRAIQRDAKTKVYGLAVLHSNIGKF